MEEVGGDVVLGVEERVRAGQIEDAMHA